MLPAEERSLAYELIKRLVLAWDPDYVKLTEEEAAAVAEAHAELPVIYDKAEDTVSFLNRHGVGSTALAL